MSRASGQEQRREGVAVTEPAPAAPEGDPRREARTVFGREPHFPSPASGVPPRRRLTPVALAGVGLPLDAGATPTGAHIPIHTGKSRFPAAAGLWGRRDTGGALLPRSDPGLGLDDELAALRESWIRPMLVGAAVALGLLALVVFARGRQAVPPAPAPPAVVEPRPTPPAPAATAAPPAPLPTRSPVAERPAFAQPSRFHQTNITQPTKQPTPPRARPKAGSERPARSFGTGKSPQTQVDPDGPLPPRL